MKYHYKDKVILKNEFYNKGVKVIINAIREEERFIPENLKDGGTKLNPTKKTLYQCELPDGDLIWVDENILEKESKK